MEDVQEVSLREILEDGTIRIDKLLQDGRRLEIRKNLSHLQQLRLHLRSALDLQAPELPIVFDERGKVPSQVRAVEAFLSFLTEQRHVTFLDRTVMQFLHSSKPLPEVWGTHANADLFTPRSSPKVRKVTVDVQLISVDMGTRLSAPALLGDSTSYFAVLRVEMARYRTRTVRGNMYFNEDTTFQAESGTAQLSVSVFSNGGMFGSPLLVGCCRLFVFPFTGLGLLGGKEVSVPLCDVRVPDFPIVGQVVMRVSAEYVASRGHLSANRGMPLVHLPLRVDTGDLLFFKTNHVRSMLSRVVTWSQFDHVAVVVAGKKLRMLEAVSDGGVCLRDMDQIMQVYLQSSSEIAVRRFRFQRTDLVREEAVRFSQETRGLPYNWNFVEMVTTATEDRPAKAMFCSQLAAALLRKIGVMPAEVIPNNYLPGTFCGAIPVTDGVAVDDLISFQGWDGTSYNPEAPFLPALDSKLALERWPFGSFSAKMNTRWKDIELDAIVTVTGLGDAGFFTLQDGREVPSAFVDMVHDEQQQPPPPSAGGDPNLLFEEHDQLRKP